MESPTSDVRAVLRLRTQAPHGLNETQADVIDRLQVLSENGTITELDVDVWGSTMGINQPAGLDPTGVQETVSEFEQWADEHDCTLQPAFERRNTESMADEEGRRRETLVLPILCLGVYDGERLEAVYPHVDGEDAVSIHDGVDALESMPVEIGPPVR